LNGCGRDAKLCPNLIDYSPWVRAWSMHEVRKVAELN